MAEELKIKEQRQVVANGFVQYSQEIVALAQQGYQLDIRNKTCPNFMLGLFTCNMILLDDEAEMATNVVDVATEAKPKRTYAKSEKAKAALRSKVPAEALQTITG